MSAGSANLLIERDTDFIKSFLVRDKTTKVPTSLVNCLIDFKVAAKQGGPEVFSIPTEIDATPTTGIFKAVLLKSEIDLITLKEGWFVINMTWSNGTTERLVEGRVVISKGVQ
jgi:hypothetical protein